MAAGPAGGLVAAVLVVTVAVGGARADAWLVPLVDLEGYVAGAELAVTGTEPRGQLLLASGWGAETGRVHYRAATVTDLAPGTELRLGWVDWPDLLLPGQAREVGVAAHLSWEPSVTERWQGRAFYGQVGATPHALDARVAYGHLRYERWLVPGWPFSARLRADLAYGSAAPAPGAPGVSGPFHALTLTVPVQLEYLRLIGRAGWAGSQEVLPTLQFHAGAYGDGWLRGYPPGTFRGSMLLGLNVEYRRTWEQAAGWSLLSLVEAGPFVDVMAVGDPAPSGSPLAWRSSYGLTAAVPLGVKLVGLDVAWNDVGQFRTAVRLSGEM